MYVCLCSWHKCVCVCTCVHACMYVHKCLCFHKHVCISACMYKSTGLTDRVWRHNLDLKVDLHRPPNVSVASMFTYMVSVHPVHCPVRPNRVVSQSCMHCVHSLFFQNGQWASLKKRMYSNVQKLLSWSSHVTYTPGIYSMWQCVLWLIWEWPQVTIDTSTNN